MTNGKASKLLAINVNYKKVLKSICLCALVFYMLPLCFGTGCSKSLLGKRNEPGKGWACDKEADEAILHNDYEAGILLHQRLLEREPENALALYHLGYAYGQTGDHLREVSYYENAIAHGFREESIFFNMGMAYCELHKTPKAIRAFKEGLGIYPDSADNHFGLGLAYQVRLANSLAEKEFLEAIKIDPKHVDARLSLSILYVDWGELQKAEGQLRKVLEIDPTNERAWRFLERIERE